MGNEARPRAQVKRINGSENLSKRALAPREKKIVGPLFSRGRSPVETILGESPVSGRRIGLSSDLRNGTLPLERGVE